MRGRSLRYTLKHRSLLVKTIGIDTVYIYTTTLVGSDGGMCWISFYRKHLYPPNLVCIVLEKLSEWWRVEEWGRFPLFPEYNPEPFCLRSMSTWVLHRHNVFNTAVTSFFIAVTFYFFFLMNISRHRKIRLHFIRDIQLPYFYFCLINIMLNILYYRIVGIAISSNDGVLYRQFHYTNEKIHELTFAETRF